MFIINDKFQDYIESKFDKNTLVIINEIVFYGIIVYYYYFGPIQDYEQNFRILKYIGLIFVLRYLLSYITEIKEVKLSDKKRSDGDVASNKYFQFNSKVAIFSILILMLSVNNNIFITLSIVCSYALLSSGAKYGYTVDNLITVIITYCLYSLNIL